MRKSFHPALADRFMEVAGDLPSIWRNMPCRGGDPLGRPRHDNGSLYADLAFADRVRGLMAHDDWTAVRCEVRRVIWLLVDLALIWPLWRNILAVRRVLRSRGARKWTVLGGVVASILVVGFSWLAAFPGEREVYGAFATFPWTEKKRDSIGPERTLEKFGHQAKLDVISPRRAWFTGVLFLPEFDIYEALKIDDPKKLEWKEHSFNLRGRHLEGAILSRAKLVK